MQTIAGLHWASALEKGSPSVGGKSHMGSGFVKWGLDWISATTCSKPGLIV